MSLPSLPSSFGAENFKLSSKYSAPTRRPIEPVGRYFLAHATRSLRGHTWSEYEKIEAEKNVSKVDETDEDADLGDEDQDAGLLAHDPRDWKTADLYSVLGISHLRFRATEDQIRRAHRKQVLKHHPDKKGEKGGLDQDGFFKIIQKAYETLLDPTKRQQYDSVDEGANVAPPAKGSDYDFFEAWGPFFEAEGRFSKKQPVPSLGDINTEKATVEGFYSFWYKIDSWRTFEFLDEDVPDDSANRDHKRYVERKNVAARKKRKTEDNSRILDLVARAIAEDPRIKLFKEAEKKEKERKKWEREAGSRAAAEAKAKKEAEEAAAKKLAEETAAAAKADAKKSKEAAKSAKKKNKRALRNAAKDNDYFGDASQAEIIENEINFLIESFDDLQLADYAAKVNGADASAAKTILSDAVKEQTSAGKLETSILKYFS
ncbi:hypothetical protein WICMUC_003112 [Wickerhamomyces mucosus]|uniref:J domain-containing protein n=1 Tax=Wickerhamomyces mucosus TaxID=1378264 RepID=A0A9P8PMD2_9ASCO|nr:hypothetical protein WICMUC_003112 [Wickerhamomyces mucosus]